MKAAQINEYGDANVVQINEVEKPTINDDQVLVDVQASSLNPFDTTVRAGYMQEMIPLQFPATLGGDIAGVITEVGGAVQNVKSGDKVYGQANVVAGNSGAFAEFAATKAAQVATMPSNLDFTQSAALPLVGVSALQGLTTHLNVQPGQKIFINGGAGGIGTVAIQIAKHLGAYVATTAKAEDAGFLSTLGADEVIDYQTQDFTELLSEYDGIFDLVGGDAFNESFKILKSGGTAVTMIAQPDEEKAKEHGITAIAQMTHVSTEMLEKLTKLVEDGVVTPQVAQIYPLEQIQEAFKTREAGNIRGKIVLNISN